jgi:hypothetical protein
MSSSGPFAQVRAFLEGLHLLAWLASGVVFIITSASSYMQGIPIVISVLAGIGATVVAAATVALGYWLVVHRFPRVLGLHIPLSKAVTKMYARLETSRYPTMMGTMPPDERLEWMCNSLLANRKDEWRVQFYGRKLPSTVSRAIPDDELKHRHWRLGTDALHEGSPNGAAVFSDVAVSRWDLRRHVKLMKATGAAAWANVRRE